MSALGSARVGLAAVVVVAVAIAASVSGGASRLVSSASVTGAAPAADPTTTSTVADAEAAAAAQPVAAHDPAAAGAFLAAWERSLSATFVVRSSFERHLAGGATMAEEVVVAQRPPDRLVRQAGTVTGRLGGRRVTCTVVDDRPVPCVDAGAAPSFGAEVAAQVDALRGLVSGPASRYAVAADEPGCFSIRLRVWEPAPPYGTSARFCFDPSTGAPSLTEVTRPDGVDRTAATSIRAPRDADFDVP